MRRHAHLKVKMFRTPIYTTATLILIFLMNSCFTGRILISVLQPAEVTIPGTIRSISIFPSAGIPDQRGIFDSLSFASLDTAYDYNLTRKGYLFGLYDALSQSPRFNRIVFADSVNSLKVTSGILTWAELDEICRHDSTDAVLLLKKAVSYDSLVACFDEQKYYDFEGRMATTCNFDYRVINKTRWTFYQPDLGIMSETFSYCDTVYFFEEGGYYKILSPRVMQGILYNSCFVHGEQIARLLVPVWDQHVKRVYYTGPYKPLELAARYVYKDHWEEAGRIWDSLSVSTNTHLASKAAFNTAVAWERDDDLDQALLWIKYADSLADNRNIKTYRKTLEKRIQTRTILDQQMGGY